MILKNAYQKGARDRKETCDPGQRAKTREQNLFLLLFLCEWVIYGVATFIKAAAVMIASADYSVPPGF